MKLTTAPHLLCHIDPGEAQVGCPALCAATIGWLHIPPPWFGARQRQSCSPSQGCKTGESLSSKQLRAVLFWKWEANSRCFPARGLIGLTHKFVTHIWGSHMGLINNLENVSYKKHPRFHYIIQVWHKKCWTECAERCSVLLFWMTSSRDYAFELKIIHWSTDLQAQCFGLHHHFQVTQWVE